MAQVSPMTTMRGRILTQLKSVKIKANDGSSNKDINTQEYYKIYCKF